MSMSMRVRIGVPAGVDVAASVGGRCMHAEVQVIGAIECSL